MPLFLDDEQINARQFASKYMDEAKINRVIKKPIFKLDSTKKPKMVTINSPFAPKPAYGIMPYFWIKIDGISRKLRYAESQNRRTEGNVMVFEYEPKRITIEGPSASFIGNEDKALFMYLNPGNPTSPFYDKTKKKYAFMDSIEATRIAAAEMDNIQKALTHASNIDEEEMVILAKGLKLLTTDDYEAPELRVKLQQFAINPQTNRRYVQSMEDEMVRVEGRIHHMVDKKVFVLTTRGATRQWVWNEGPRKGEHIGIGIMNPNEDAKQRLINFIKGDLGNYLSDLRSIGEILKADRKAREVLQAEKEPKPVQAPTVVPDHLLAVNAPEPELRNEINTFVAARDYVGDKGYPKTSLLIKEFYEAVQMGDVTYDNVDAYLVKLYEKK